MKELEYSISTQELDDKFTLYSKELSLSISGVDIDECYIELKDRISQKKLLFESIGIELKSKSGTKKRQLNLYPFTKKWGSLFLVLLCISVVFITSINVIGTQIFNHRYSRLERRVLETITPSKEKQKERIERFKIKMKSYSPYIKETKLFFNNRKEQ